MGGRVTCTIQEIVEEIAYIMQKSAETLVDLAGKILEELEKAISDIETEPRARAAKRSGTGRDALNRDTGRKSGGANGKGPIAGYTSRPKSRHRRKNRR